jgi:pimeloyl-ACP methyl ester carboxylesterase
VEGDATRSPLMLIHGAWLSSRSWDPFAEYFTRRALRRIPLRKRPTTRPRLTP